MEENQNDVPVLEDFEGDGRRTFRISI